MKRGIEYGKFDQEYIENADETQFIFNLDNGRTLGIMSDNSFKYTDVVSRDEPMSMMVRITGGKNAYIEPPFLISKNSSGSYPILGVPDNVPGVSYRSTPKRSMDSTMWVQFISERRSIPVYSGSKNRIFFRQLLFSD